MTERLPIGWLSVGAFVLILGFLAVQLGRGHDPLLGAAQAPDPRPRRVLVRRIVRRVVVVRVIAAQNATPTSASSAPVVSAGPALSAPSLPAPAPVSRSS